MNEFEELSQNKYDEYLKSIDLYISDLDETDIESPEKILNTIRQNCMHIQNKFLSNKKLSNMEKSFFYNREQNSENKKKLIDNDIFEDLVFKEFYEIYLTDTNNEINKMSISHSGGKPIRDIYKLKDITPEEIVLFLKKASKKFKLEILKKDHLDREDNALKKAVEKEYKEYEKEINKENEDAIFKTILFSKMIYLNLLEMDFKKEKITFFDKEFELNIGFYVHISFRHHFQILKNSKKYQDKDHFTEENCIKSREIILKLSEKLKFENRNLDNKSVVNFKLKDEYFRLVFGKKTIVSFFKLNDDAVSKIANIQDIITIQ